MKHVVKLQRHHTSYQVVLPKRLIAALGWQFQDVLVIIPEGKDGARVVSLETWADRMKNKEEEGDKW